MMKMNLQGQPKGRIPNSELRLLPLGVTTPGDSNFHFYVQKSKDSPRGGGYVASPWWDSEKFFAQ